MFRPRGYSFNKLSFVFFFLVRARGFVSELTDLVDASLSGGGDGADVELDVVALTLAGGAAAGHALLVGVGVGVVAVALVVVEGEGVAEGLAVASALLRSG